MTEIYPLNSSKWFKNTDKSLIYMLSLRESKDWTEIFKESEDFKRILLSIGEALKSKAIQNDFNVSPPLSKIFRAFYETPLSSIKVVIIGQDPYFDPGAANGLAFSIEKDFKPVPPTLRNIVKEISKERYEAGDFDITHWPSQGVFMLNTILTVTEGKDMALSHARLGWEDFTSQTVQTISSRCNHIIFMLWGGKAQVFKKIINSSKGKNYHFILETSHPSPLGAYAKSPIPFNGSKVFNQANEILKCIGKSPINF